MTDNEFTKALECCVRYKQICPETCPMVNVRQCKVDLRKSTLDLINRRNAEIDRLNIELKAMRGAANSYKAEIERLKKDKELLGESSPEQKQNWKESMMRTFLGGRSDG